MRVYEWLVSAYGRIAYKIAGWLPRVVVIAVVARACREWAVHTRAGNLNITKHPFDAHMGHIVSFQHGLYGILPEDREMLMETASAVFSDIGGVEIAGPGGDREFNVLDYIDATTNGRPFEIKN
jgi:hypothetical protein